MRRIILSFLFLFLISFPSYVFADGPYLNIPPTNAFDKIHSDNGTINAVNFSMPLIIKGGSGITVTSNNATHVIKITGTTTNGTTITALTCPLNYQLHTVNSTGFFTCAPNNGTSSSFQGTYNQTLANNVVINSGGYKINFINGSNNPVNVKNSGNQVNITISSPSASAITSINGNTSAAQILQGTARNITVTNTGNIHTWNLGDLVVVINGAAQTITKALTLNSLFLGGNANGGNFNFTNLKNVNATKFFQNSKQVIDTLSSGSGISITGSGNSRTITNTGVLSAITSINSQTGPAINIVCQTGNTTCTNSTNQIKIGIGSNVVTGGSNIGKAGVGFFKQIITGQAQFRNLTSTNAFVILKQNTTDNNLNATIPTNYVIDFYDTTIGDYNTPSNATSSTNVATNSSSNNGQTGSNLASFVGDLFFGKFTGLLPGATISKVGVNTNIAAGNIRVKVYQDNGGSGNPGTLLAESNSLAVSGTGIKFYSLNTNAVVPASGNVWAAFEVDSNTYSMVYKSVASSPLFQVHTYGTGPATASISADTHAANLIINSSLASTPKAFDGNTATEWISKSEVHPNIYFDSGSAQILSGFAIYPDSSTTTCTQILLQTSTDANTWNTKRTINTSLLINGAWNFIRWDLDQSTERYVRDYCNDAGSTVMAVWEAKILIPSSITLELRHGHKIISNTDGTLSLGS